MKEEQRAIAKQSLEILNTERMEIGAICKMKKDSPQSVERHIQRLRRRRSIAGRALMSLPVDGSELIAGVQKYKTTVNVLTEIIKELEDAEIRFNELGHQIASINDDLKKGVNSSTSRSSVILPE
jgi:hypothetical protein